MVTNESGTFDIGGDLTVHRLGFGVMRITGDRIIGEPDDVANAKQVLRAAVDTGVDFSRHRGLVRAGRERATHPRDAPPVRRRGRATKGGLMRNREGDWIPNGHPDYLRNALLCSLDRLGVDSIDLYQLHRPDPNVPYEASIEALAELKDEGVVRHVGVSNVSVDQLETARDIVDVATVQNRYSVVSRDAEPVLEAGEAYDIGFISWYPVGAGDLGEKEAVLDDVAAAALDLTDDELARLSA